MNERKILVILVLPIIIFCWGLGWFLNFVGEWFYNNSKQKYILCLKILKTEGFES